MIFDIGIMNSKNHICEGNTSKYKDSLKIKEIDDKM